MSSPPVRVLERGRRSRAVVQLNAGGVILLVLAGVGLLTIFAGFVVAIVVVSELLA